MINGQITYTKSVDMSMKLVNESLRSFRKYAGWNMILNKGLSKDTWESVGSKFDYGLMENGRLDSMKKTGDKVLNTKLACVFNNVLFWHAVLEYGRPMVFVEHDIICKADYLKYKFDEYLILNIEDAIKGNPKLNKSGIFSLTDEDQQIIKTVDWSLFHNKLNSTKPGIHKLVDLEEYSLSYYKNNRWKRSPMVPGTACYALTPKGAERLIHAAKTYGLDQSDFIINSATVNIEYVLPSPVRFNTTYINTSHIT
ncbi:hypothetical protein LCGC14_1017550 [marine sediment metagenome]|uniref:Nucleotide-diphospho-sugar transferase domain-containing protein n=1 Tax=marine sediment metagenome TaxID=412755 RepID=A0A0F9QGQ1_9ZZZZ